MSLLKKILKIILPKFIIIFLKKKYEDYSFSKLKNFSNYNIFKKIYEEKIWTPENKKKNFAYYSGYGSHHEGFSKPYVNKVSEFLNSFDKKQNILELGCGDFFVSSKLVHLSNNFIACDVFKELIELNKKKFNNLKVDFRVLDMTKDDLPKADICIVRCVLQHLSNEMILKFIKNAENKFKFLLVTEHYPSTEKIIPNLNIITGPSIRLNHNSAVDLSEPPFNLKCCEKKDLCRVTVKSISGYLRTQLYRFY